MSAKVFYGLHMAPGMAEYKSDDGGYKLFIDEPAIKKMDHTFSGKPVFVDHVDQVENSEPHGYVVESFFNKSDGKHWAKFIVFSQRAAEALSQGWRLSNAYKPVKLSSGGRWHGMDFDKEVVEGEYEHLAIVENPRYEESVVMTPEQFRQYNLEKESELLKIANSKTKEKGSKIMGVLSFFKKERLDNSADIESMSVVLPKSKREVSITQLVNAADDMALKEGKPEYAVGHALVKTNEGEEMTVEELLNKYSENCGLLKKQNEEEEEEEKKKEDIPENEDEKDEDEKEENEDEGEKEEEKKHYNSLKNAHEEDDFEAGFVDLSVDKLARGQSRYGSK